MCRKKNRSKAEQTNTVTEKETQTSGDHDQEYTMFHVRSGPSKPYKAVVKANGNHISMEIDAEASVSVVGEDTFGRESRPLSSKRRQSDCRHM